MQEIMLVEQKELREQMIGRVEILDKVEGLFLIPKTKVLIVKQVAEYFEVRLEAIQSCYKDNKEELDNDGVMLKSYMYFLTVGEGQLETSKGKVKIYLQDNVTIEVPNRGIKVFPKRAILRMAMLLRDSKVAKEIRT